jgi:site-specific recombinase XerD
MPRKDLKFRDFTKDMFIWGKCTYIQYLQTKQQRFSRSYADSQRNILEKHLLPYFGDLKLSNIKVDRIESFLQKLSQKKYKSTSISNYYNTLSTIMKEAFRLDVFPSNPMIKVRRINKKTKEKGIFNMDEVKQLFGKDSLNKIWNGQLQQIVFNLIELQQE